MLLTGCSLGGSDYASSFFAVDYRVARDSKSVSESEEKPVSVADETDDISFMYEDICYSTEDTPVKVLSDGTKYKSALAFNIDQTEILYSKDMHERIFPASTTKLMTALIAIKHSDMDDIVHIAEDNCGIKISGAQLCGFSAGDTITMRDLLYCLLVYSGNDAALAIATHIGETERGFVRMMNKEAKELGCINTSFVNPHGLHDPNHYTTAYDMYLIFNECLRYDFIGTYEAPYGITVYGGKTGDTYAAGKCLMLYVEDYKQQGYIAEIFGSSTKEELYTSMNRIFNYILSPTT